MKLLSLSAFCLCLVSVFAFRADNKVPVKEAMDNAKQHLWDMAAANTDTEMYPRSTKPDGSLFKVKSRDWTSGFFPGSLWMMYDYTKDKKWEKLARTWTAGIEKEQFNKGTHDLGFMLYCSFGNGYRLTNDPAYKNILVQGAKSLITRFNKNTGVIKSWDHNKDKWQYPVIIDNMMNLELLFETTRAGG